MNQPSDSVRVRLQKATKRTGDFFRNASTKTKQFISNFKIEKQFVKELESMAQEALNKAELLETASLLEAKAKTLRAIAKEM